MLWPNHDIVSTPHLCPSRQVHRILLHDLFHERLRVRNGRVRPAVRGPVEARSSQSSENHVHDALWDRLDGLTAAISVSESPMICDGLVSRVEEKSISKAGGGRYFLVNACWMTRDFRIGACPKKAGQSGDCY